MAAGLLALITVPESPNKTLLNGSTLSTIYKRLDLTGFVLFAGSAAMLLLALEWGGTMFAWNSSRIVGLLCGGAATIIVFIFWERHVGDGAMIPLSMVRRRVVWSACLVTFFFFGTLILFTYYLPIYLQTVRGLSPLMSGVYVLPGIAGQMITATVSGILGDYRPQPAQKERRADRTQWANGDTTCRGAWRAASLCPLRPA